MAERAIDGRLAHHGVRLRHRAGATELDLTLALGAPWTILFGPSGAGKTTILRAVAGLLRPEEARITRAAVDATGEPAEVLTDTAAGRATPVHMRRVGYAPQQPALFPHRTVLENVLFGIKRGRGGASAEGRREVEPILAMLRIPGLVEKYPAQLSGGEAQRVSLARAFATAFAPQGSRSRLFVLDEPFTGLELSLRDQILPEIREWVQSQEIPVLSVTHDVGEAFLLRAEVVRLIDGRVVEQGAPEVVLRAERERLMAQLGEAGAEMLSSSEPYLAG